MKISREGRFLLGWFVATLMLLLLAIFLTGCKSVQYVKVPEVHERVVHDTLHTADSVYIDKVHFVMQKGDTIYKTDSVFVYKYKTLDKVVEVLQKDTITQVQEVQVPVRMRNGYDRFVSWGFWLLFAAFLLCVAWKVAKWYIGHK